MKPSKQNVALSPGQWAIMKVVWESQPCAAPSVQEALQPTRNWAYSTVRTLMDRLVAQGVLTAEKVRHLTLYRAAITPEQAQRSEVLQALKNAFNGALTPMLQCLLKTSDVTPEELAELEKLIREKRRNTKL